MTMKHWDSNTANTKTWREVTSEMVFTAEVESGTSPLEASDVPFTEGEFRRLLTKAVQPKRESEKESAPSER